MTPKQQAYKALGNTMIKNFKKRNIEAFYCEDSASAVALAMELMKDGGTVGKGGTETIREVGLLDAVKSAEHLTFIDREVAKNITITFSSEITDFTQSLPYRFWSIDVCHCGNGLYYLNSSEVPEGEVYLELPLYDAFISKGVTIAWV